MAITAKGRDWELRNSLWIGWTFTVYFYWIAFLWIGVRAGHRRWIAWGVFYAIPFLCTFFSLGTETTVQVSPEAMIFVMLGFCGASILHAFYARAEYLVRIEAKEFHHPLYRDQLRRQLWLKAGHSEASYLPAYSVMPPTSGQWVGNLATVRVASVEPPRPAPLVYVNTATEQILADLPGIGPIGAKRLVDVRTRTGGFRSVEEVGHTLDLNPHMIERIRSLVRVEPPATARAGIGLPTRIVDV